jgi:hypothetical protein
MSTAYHLSRNRVVAQLELDEHRRPVAVVILLDTGDRVRIDAPKDLARLIRTLRMCEDQWKQANTHGR